jgi:hypothetical protein
MKKTAIFFFAVAAAAVFSQKAAAQLPDVSTAENPVWYYIEVQGEPDRAGRIFTLLDGDSVVYGRSKTASTDEAELGRQLWRIEQNGDDYTIVNKTTGKKLDVSYYSAKSISVAAISDNPTTRWKLLPAGEWYNLQATAAPAGGDASKVYLHQANDYGSRDFVIMLENSGYNGNANSRFGFVPLIAPVEVEAEDIRPLWNPDRGLHLESIFQVDVDGKIANPYGRGAGQGAVGSEVYPEGFMDTRNDDFQSWGDSVTLTQLYIYLTSFWDVDTISQAGLEHIQQLFDGLREHKVKAILRFAYSRDNGYIGNGHSGANPDYDRMMKHIDQLKPLIEKNFDVISFIEAGFMGTWGEWTPSYGGEQNSNVVKALFSAIPRGYGIVVRYPGTKDGLKSAFSEWDFNSRIGLANDYFTAGLKNCGSSDICLGSDEYWKVADGSFTVFMRGEVPYNEGPPWGFDIFMGMDRMLRYLKDHHYTTMDITQNFKDNITYWKTLKVYPELLKKYNVFFDDSYFEDENGATVARSFYQFTRDHLGYRLNLLPASTVAIANDTLTYDLKITNTGFATVLNPRPVYLALIDEAGKIVKEERLSAVNPRAWQPWAKGDSAVLLTHDISGNLPLPAALPNGLYKVGLWMPDSFPSLQYNPAYCIKLATDNQAATHWTDASNTRTVNIVGKARVGEAPGNGNGATAIPTAPEKKENVKVYARSGYLRVEGTSATPTVYNLMGGALDAKSKLPTGIYIVKVDGLTVKVLVE